MIPALLRQKHFGSLCISAPLVYYLIYTLAECQHLEWFEGQFSFKFSHLLPILHSSLWTKKLKSGIPFRNSAYFLQDFSMCKLHFLLGSTNNMEVWGPFCRSGNQPVLRILNILHSHVNLPGPLSVFLGSRTHIKQGGHEWEVQVNGKDK